jgi:hypothetical protein
MNTTNTIKTEQKQKTGEGLPVHPEHAVGTFYRVAWSNGGETGEETETYTSFMTAVQIAEMLQRAANDRPFNVRFSVTRTTGNQSETVYRCQ